MIKTGKIFRNEVPLIVISEKGKNILGSNIQNQYKEKVIMELEKSYIGVIHTALPHTDIKKIYCISSAINPNKNIVTTYMGYGFNSDILVHKPNENDDAELFDESMEISHFCDIFGSRKNIYDWNCIGYVKDATRILLQLHATRIKGLEVVPLNLESLTKIYCGRMVELSDKLYN